MNSEVDEGGKSWCLHDHKSSSGRREVRQYYDDSRIEVQAAFDVAWEYLEVQPREQWQRPKAHRMNKSKLFKDFFEIRLFANQLQHRPIGYFGPVRGKFTLLIWATEKGNRIDPASWDATSKARMDAIAGQSAQSTPWNDDEIKQINQVKDKALSGPIRAIALGARAGTSDKKPAD